MRLVEAYSEWVSCGVPDPEQAPSDLPVEHDIRAAYIDYASARWSRPQDAPAWGALKSLVPLVLLDGTVLDATLARLIGLRLNALTDQELDEAARVCAASLTTGRPWELGQWSSELLAQIW
jgi:hypothetical protein